MISQRFARLGSVLLVFLTLLAVGLGRWTHNAPAAAPEPLPILADSAPGAARHPDSTALETFSRLVGVPPLFTFALAWEETRNNPDPKTRGKHGEWGRFQVKETTARARCPGFNIKTAEGNLACFLKMAREDRIAGGSWWHAARVHNGSGEAARAYADRVIRTVGQLALSD